MPIAGQEVNPMKLKPAYITIEDEDGNIIERIPMTAADDDWIRAGRLRKKAEAGDKEAAKKLKEMENTQMMEVVDDEQADESEKSQDNMKSNFQIIKGDITTQQLDAIVNAANNSLLGGGGVDGAIHRAAGKELIEECKTLNGCETGQAKITKGYKLPAKYVIHTVGPVWRGGDKNEEKLLEGCYRNSLKLAVEHNIKTIAFPSISTGVYGYPIEKASIVALKTIHDFLEQHESIKKVVIVCFSQNDYDVYRDNLDMLV